MTLKLYVWEDVLCDYTSGIAFALAENKKMALALLARRLSDVSMEEIRAKKPKIRRTKCAYFTYGGG